ncbi:MAG: hypothetical protein M0Z85_08110 [Gammaproteobacteria bacterium]|nr:hypothetical protein [Gammaproteobacteria bacterium]
MPNIIAAAQRILDVADEDSAEFAIVCYHDAADVAQALVEALQTLHTIAGLGMGADLEEYAANMARDFLAKLEGDGDGLV